MLNIFIQGLTLLSGLLVNFTIPAVFGLEQYGVFLKANILVFLFHRISDLVGEPLIVMVDKNSIFLLSLLINAFVFVVFVSINLVTVLGDPKLLGSMLWSNSVLLMMYAYQKLNFIFVYLMLFIFVFFLLMIMLLSGAWDVTIVDILILVNFLSATIFFCLMLLTEKNVLNVSNILLCLKKVVPIAPNLFFSSLINNMFTNIFPYYLASVFSPTMLGLYRVQVSLAQSVVALFPMSTKIIMARLVDGNKTIFFQSLVRFSFNYFYLITLVSFFLVVLVKHKVEYTQILILMPVIHITIIYEKYMLVMARKNFMIVANLLVCFLASCMIINIHTVLEMNLLYASSICLYLFVMFYVSDVQHLNQILFVIFSTMIIMFVSIYSTNISFVMLLCCVFIFFRSHKNFLHNWEMIR